MVRSMRCVSLLLDARSKFSGRCAALRVLVRLQLVWRRNAIRKLPFHSDTKPTATNGIVAITIAIAITLACLTQPFCSIAHVAIAAST